jgi:parallel beta-helix repeat protein
MDLGLKPCRHHAQKSEKEDNLSIRKAMKKIKIALLGILILFATASLGWSATYYVDATGGNDSNNGISEATPWKTIVQVNSNSFSPGDSILFKKGAMWRERMTVPSSGSTGNVITFGAYGTGAAPIISGSNLITGGWSKDSANIWKSTVTTRPTIVYFNGSHGKLVAAKANITSEFKWYWVANVLYVWSPPDSDPSAYYASPGIEAGARTRALQTNNKTYVTFDGLTLRDANTNDSVVNVGSNIVTSIVFQNCVVERGGGSGFSIKGSTIAASVAINNCTIQNNAGFGIWFENMYTAATVSNNTVTGNGWGSLRDSQQYSGIQGRLGNVAIFGNTIHDNTLGTASANNQSHGIYALATTAVVNIHDNVIFNHPNGEGIKLIGSANVYRNIIYGNATGGIEVGQNGSTNVVYLLHYNVIYGNGPASGVNGIVEQSKGTGKISLTVENNTIYQNGGTGQQELKIADNIAALIVKNNLFYAAPTRRTMWVLAQTGTVSIDYNLHWRADGNPSIYYGGNEKTWAQWQVMGYDLHGVNGAPLLVSASTSDFSLQSTSPCINAGTDVGLSVDLAGRQVPYGAAPDIGAYEWWSPHPSAPRSPRIVPN